MKSFHAQIQDFANLTKKNMKYVATGAIQDVLEAAQTPQIAMTKGNPGFVEGKIPVAESDLINSLTSEGITGPQSYAVAIAGMDIGDYLQFAWTAPYARRIESGFTGTDSKGRAYNVPGRHFVGANAARFATEFVPNRVREVKSR